MYTRLYCEGVRGARYLGTLAARVNGQLAADGDADVDNPFAGAAPVAVEPLLRPTVGRAPGGSGFFYTRPRCDHVSCPNAMADAPAVTWTLISEHDHVHEDDGNEDGGGGGGGGSNQETYFTLEPMTAPGLTLAGVPISAANLEVWNSCESERKRPSNKSKLLSDSCVWQPPSLVHVNLR